MLKDITSCPECGRRFADVGVVELRCLHHYTDDAGMVLGDGTYEETRFECGFCGYPLEFRDSDESGEIQIIG